MEVIAIKNKDQIAKMKKNLRSSSMRDYGMFVIGINIGLRISDLVTLKFSDLYEDGKIKDVLYIKDKKTKNNKSKRLSIVTINSSAKAIIKEYKSSITNFDYDQYLFQSRKGLNEPISERSAWRILNTAGKQVGIKHIGTHSMRKTFGYWIYKKTKDIALVQKMLNHKSSADTLRYIGITQDDMTRAVKNLNL